MQHVTGAGSSSASREISESASQATDPSPSSAPTSKLRSCTVCRSRRVRCDKQSPCSNCRRAKIVCVMPPVDRPPRWTRRLEPATVRNGTSVSKTTSMQDPASDVGRIMDRVHNLEDLVKDLRGQLEEARAGSNSSAMATPHLDALHDGDTPYAMESSDMQKQFGRLVLQDQSKSRYVTSIFWSRVNDELDGLKMDIGSIAGEDLDSSDDETLTESSPPTQNLERTPLERNAFLFPHSLNSSTQSSLELHPLPSQVPFLLDSFSENVNFLMQIVHMPTIKQTVRDLRGAQMMNLTPAVEALLFSIYYTAISSLGEDDVMISFGASRHDLCLKYRLGFECALAKADFLGSPDIVLVQAITIFLAVVRREDSPRFVWMMTGIAIRMAQYLGLQRDGSHFENLKPYEIEIRRRVWWSLCSLDLRASEDQGTDLAISRGSFDTKVPLNINDADLSPATEKLPTEHDGITDMSIARIASGLCDIMRQMMFRLGGGDGPTGLEQQNRLLNEIYQTYERGYLQYTTESNMAYWFTVTVARITMAKMTLIVFLPALFSSPSEDFSYDLRNRLLVSAIEVAEYNHALNTEQAYRHWHWICQSYTHWHAIVYIMIETSRRPWTAMAERAWIALHSPWLIPAKTSKDRNPSTWVPLRSLMAKCRMHRAAELERLQLNPHEAERLDMEDQKIPLPSSMELPRSGTSVDSSRTLWWKLVAPATLETQQPTQFRMTGPQADQPFQINDISEEHPAIMRDGQPLVSSAWLDNYATTPGSTPQSGTQTHAWGDIFSNLDVDHNDLNFSVDFGDMDWCSWIESANAM